MPRPIHFEIPADDPERALAFYREIFGWKFEKWEGPTPYWLITTGPADEPGINGGLLPRPHPAAPPVNTIGVPSLDASLKAVETRGGRTVVPRMAVPGIGWLAYCADTEGNTFGMLEADAAAG
jgi:predicted enzyme related to lactoylglutathione lyase